VCAQSGLSDCDARIPSLEECDGEDNDCNGVTDEGTLCEDGNECTNSWCQGVAGCQTEFLEQNCSDDGDPCTEDLCVSGVCTHPPGNDGAPCDDGDPCTLDEVCSEGICSWTRLNPLCQAICGDGVCSTQESGDPGSPVYCAVDCGACGDGICGLHEMGPNGGSCPKDCLAVCGNGKCEGGESVDTCLLDCSGCGDGICGMNESFETCATDCPPACGNGLCEMFESPQICPVDCMPPCGDGICSSGENPQGCPVDCPVCGDGVCGFGETIASCPQDCATACGNGICEGGETGEGCPVDCGFCGDGVCGYYERYDTCPTDCFQGCGDGACGMGETCTTCPRDCGQCCGNGLCESVVGESSCTCPTDCGVCPGCCSTATCRVGTSHSFCGMDGGACLDCAHFRMSCVEQECAVVCGDGRCHEDETCATCQADCGCKVCGETCEEGHCLFTACVGRECGNDGCGGTCGNCTVCGETCLAGLCQFTSCAERECGADGCGGSCGTCADHYVCESGSCLYVPWCGDGTCDSDEDCDTCPQDCGGCCGNGACEPWFGEHCESCLEDCGCTVCGETCQAEVCTFTACIGRECGEDGCGGSCGTCQMYHECQSGMCVYVPWCGDKTCDPNEDCSVCAVDCPCTGCGESCEAGQCTFTACAGRECGDDGCGGSCGTCDEHNECQDGACAYVPWCGDGACDLHVGENCATCPADCGCTACGETCESGQCVFTACGGKECGSNGCGGSCGTCPFSYVCTAGQCEYSASCGNSVCDEDETCDSCASDCGECCGNGVCEGQFGEHCGTCAADCGCTACGDTCVLGTCQFTACDLRQCGEDGCGGSCGTCEEHFECQSGQCVYVPWCGDGTCDAGENCGTCQADCGLCQGLTCTLGTDCHSGHCTDGVCCNTSCREPCRACNLPGFVGVCGMHPLFADPDDDCPVCSMCNGSGACIPTLAGTDPVADCVEENPCGRDGVCDGVGACRLWSMGTMCLAASCAGTTYTLAALCDGLGGCTPGGTGSCAPYACDGASCRTNCGQDSHCATGNFCSGSKCTAKRSNGWPCQGANECTSGYCVDGFCCNTTCAGVCRSCGRSGSEGTCNNHIAETDPEGECGLCRACNGSGVCATVGPGMDPLNHCMETSPTTCAQDGTCNGSGACRLWSDETQCVPQSCQGSILHRRDYCSGDGVCLDSGIEFCDPYRCEGTACRTQCEADEHCVSGYYCDSSQECVLKKTTGVPCHLSNECNSGFCADGVCCQSACNGICRSCSLSGFEGTCRHYSTMTDPEGECGLCRTCNGLGSCAAVPVGQDPLDHCASTLESTCGHDGTCDGTGGCRFWNASTPCAQASCLVHTFFPVDYCDGLGQCQDSGSQDCSPYLCQEDRCGANCQTNANCVTGFFCDPATDLCSSNKELGELCNQNSECGSKLCVDGVCCVSSCEGLCRACNLVGQEGQCGFAGLGMYPGDECGVCHQCDGAGGCMVLSAGIDIFEQCPEMPESTCGTMGWCDQYGSCELWTMGTPCASARCEGDIFHPEHRCDGAGLCVAPANLSCSPHACDLDGCLSSCTSHDHCSAGAYCLVNTCAIKKGHGVPCDAAAECTSGHCVDGVCCATVCSGACRSCAIPGGEGSCFFHFADSDPDGDCGLCEACNGGGSCAFVAAGFDPLAQCTATAQNTCGLDGQCNGAGVCRHWSPSTVCSAQTCTDGRVDWADYCSGDGSCVDSGFQWCAPFTCVGVACRTTCTLDLHCQDGHYCHDGDCVEKGTNGNSCGAGTQCVSGFCVDGVCCGSLCNGVCQACHLPGSEGICSGHPDQTDPEGECGLCKVCSGFRSCVPASDGSDPLGHCDADLDATCGLDGQCDGTGSCRLWNASTVCVAPSCELDVLTPGRYCDGSGTCLQTIAVSCHPYSCRVDGMQCSTSCEADADCAQGFLCREPDNECLKLNPGEACPGHDYCLSGHCVDGVCCDTACEGECRSCSIPGKAGICSFYIDLPDPELECGLCRMCDNFGSCVTVPPGQDPLGQCDAAPVGQEPCGLDGSCDGSGACRFRNSSTVCQEPSCEDSVRYLTSLCDGEGFCVDSGTQSCAPYHCDGLECRTSCFEDGHCVSDHYCSEANTCLPKTDAGGVCSRPGHCVSGFCADGVCCTTACSGTCRGCRVPGMEGTCMLYGNQSDPDLECGLCRMCNGMGSCAAVPAGQDYLDQCEMEPQSACGKTGVCNGSGACALYSLGTICEAESCIDGIHRHQRTCDGSGNCSSAVSDACEPYVCSGSVCRSECSLDAHCVSTHFCLGTACESKKATGEPCLGGNQCQSGFCIDDVCCLTTCACGESCATGQCVFVACEGKECGNDGCGGSCGTCPFSHICVNGVCQYSASCGNDVCDEDETCDLCPDDCGLCCGNHVCDGGFGENCLTCPADCGECCGDGVCDTGYAYGENCDTCPEDCPCTECGHVCQSGVCTFTACDGRKCGTDVAGCGADCGTCAVHHGCVDGVCVYVPWCGDAVCDPGEDCLSCPTDCGLCNGQTCAEATQCHSGFCSDALCCNEACDGPCESCTAPLFQGVCTPYGEETDPEGDCGPCAWCSGSGSCAPIPAQTDPRDECGTCAWCSGYGNCASVPYNTDPREECGLCRACDGAHDCADVTASTDPLDHCASTPETLCGHDGQCDGNGACRFWSSDSLCASPFCSGSTFSPGRFCDGQGSCQDAADQSCLPYLCEESGMGCRTACSQDVHCVGDAFCNNSVCTIKWLHGTPCTTSNQCMAGHCVDGVCCISACNGPCQTCLDPGYSGYCQYFAAHTDPEGDCDTCEACDGAGSCTPVDSGTDPVHHCTSTPEVSCEHDGECDGFGACRFWSLSTICAPQSCQDSTLHPTDYCSGGGSCVDSGTQPCDPYRCDGVQCRTMCTDTEHCVAGFFCADGTCEAKHASGASCSAGIECQSGFCADGVCCNTACDGECETCAAPGLLGVCAPHGSQTDPEGECGLCGWCSGSGGCSPIPANTDPRDECGLCSWCSGSGGCSPIPPNTDPEGECGLCSWCSGSGGCSPIPANTDPRDECGLCSWCSGSGGCSPIPANTDPRDECGLCQVCNGGEECTPAEAGTDPLDHCGSTPKTLCGLDGECDGTGLCRLWNPETVCGSRTCADYTLYPADYCSGDGTCVESSPQSCHPYVCDGPDCRTTCSSDSHCVLTHYCAGPSCVPRTTIGSGCTANNQCLSGFCLDAVCCSDDCTGDCRACNVAGAEGTCTFLANHSDPAGECGLCRDCNGSGACKNVANGQDAKGDCAPTPATLCGQDGQCDGNGACRFWNSDTVCNPQTCTGNTLHPADYCSGNGTCVDSGTQSCGLYLCAGNSCLLTCSDDPQCLSGYYCQSGSCVVKKTNGTTCSGANQCQSGFCVDGVCCGTACAGTCMSCGISGIEGTCTLFGNNSDPHAECSLCQVCNGAASCVPVANGLDPTDDCIQSSPVTCGHDGTCDGYGFCRYWDSTTQCLDQSCVGSVLSLPGLCTGAGDCGDGGLQSCSPYACNATETDCRTSCTLDEHCVSSHYCHGTECVAKKTNGKGCDQANQCISGFCADGVCCDTACDGECRSCWLPGSVGTCTFHAGDTDPDLECGLCQVCNGTGACANVANGNDPLGQCSSTPETLCGHDGQCDGNGACRFWDGTTVCAAQSCSGSDLTSRRHCDGNGDCAPGTTAPCEPYACNVEGTDCRVACSEHGHCSDGFRCVGSACHELTLGFVGIPAGAFWMGSPAGTCPTGYPGSCSSELGRGTDEGLQYVRLTRAFEIQTYEITQDNWKSVSGGTNPSYYSSCGGACPVEQVTWFSLLWYANQLSTTRGYAACYAMSGCSGSGPAGTLNGCSVSVTAAGNNPYQCTGYRLPTEAEWEYAARGGSNVAFYPSDGNNGTITYSGVSPLDPNLDKIAWYGGNSGGTGGKPVGGKAPNSWGLYDVSGNVWEWVWDWYSASYAVGTVASPSLDPLGPGTGTHRPARAGGSNDEARACRLADRSTLLPSYRAGNLGARLVRTIEFCGDGICNAAETCQSCEADCGSCCGNGTCEPAFGETCSTCAVDCGCTACGYVCISGTCTFTACSGRNCGNDGCGGSCGTCSVGWACAEGLCVSEYWTDPGSGLTWENPPSATPRTWSQAGSYCGGLGLAGGGWRLPSISELRTLVRGCSTSETGGSCNVTDGGCLSNSCISGCPSCTMNAGPAGGCYWPSGLQGACSTLYWSSSQTTPTGTGAWGILYDSAYIINYIKDSPAVVRCVR
jgi:formylglycine-generating enzyme required for sulfatase activity